MFNQIFDAIEEWMRELLTGMISSNLDRMFTDVNQKTSEIAGQVGQTPQGWNGSIFSMIEGLSNSVMECSSMFTMIITAQHPHMVIRPGKRLLRIVTEAMK